MVLVYMRIHAYTPVYLRTTWLNEKSLTYLILWEGIFWDFFFKLTAQYLSINFAADNRMSQCQNVYLSLGSGTTWERLGGVDLLEQVWPCWEKCVPRMGFWVSKVQVRTNVSLFLLPVYLSECRTLRSMSASIQPCFRQRQ